MTPEQRTAIVEERLAKYRERLNQHQATPIIMIGVSAVREDDEPRLIVSIPEDYPLADVRDLLQGLLQDVKARLARGLK